MNSRHLHIDLETYSSVNLKTAGVYKYVRSIDFEIILLAYAFDAEPITVIDLASGEKIPTRVLNALTDKNVQKWAHNATFERLCLAASGIVTKVEEWFCSMAKTAYCGWPLQLAQVSEVMGLGDKGKLTAGRALIKYFCIPCRPTKANGDRCRNLPQHDPEKWSEFKNYCAQDVEAEREIVRRLEKHSIPDTERELYIVDQIINDRGIKVDLTLARNAYRIDQIRAKQLSDRAKELTGLENPNSAPQLKKWLSEAMNVKITSLAKELIPELLEQTAEGDAAREVLELRLKMSKTSISKYTAMSRFADRTDHRVRGLFQYYGASRTGRWAGRGVQLHNLPRNYIDYLEEARADIRAGDYATVLHKYDNIPTILSQLIRTSFVAPEGYTLDVADFSSIEARVVAWLAGEDWRLNIFNTHGKIYEASAAMMFNVPLASIDKDSDYRARGKVAELALGFGGSVGALKTMGGEAMGLSDDEMTTIVRLWREKSPRIVSFWADMNRCALKAVRIKRKVVSKYRGLEFYSDGKYMSIKLPSGRKLFYQGVRIGTGKFGQKAIKYKGLHSQTNKWVTLETYGGKLTENITQAIARDLLAEAIKRLHAKGYEIVMHVHDEVACERPVGEADNILDKMIKVMSEGVTWAEGLPLGADGYTTPFYKKA